MNKQISILGCGWLGLPLATELVKMGHLVKGSTTSESKIESLKNKQIIPFIIATSEKGVDGDINEFLKDSEILIINIPPGLRKNPDANFVKQMDLLCKEIEGSKIKKVLYVSSTSVYEEDFDIPIFTENSQTNGKSSSAKQLIATEKIFKNSTNFETTILRFGGLIGADRDPAKYLAGKKNLKDPDGPVNLIHQEDCIGVIKAILNGNHGNDEFNSVAPQHPSRETYYTTVCEVKNLPLPKFDHQIPSKGKIISNEKVEQILNYTFLYNL